MCELMKITERGKKSEDRLGEKNFTNEGYEIEIVNYRKAIDIDVVFPSGYIVNTTYNYFKKGSIRNVYHPSVYGVGYLGEGEYLSRKGAEITKCYDTWHSLLRRSYWKDYHASETSYKNVTVCEEWHNFQVFAKWFYEKYDFKYMVGWDLDKDIICPECKIYSPETCNFVPNEINKFFVKKKIKENKLPLGVQVNHYSYKAEIHRGKNEKINKSFPSVLEAATFYKFEKEAYAKILANKWKGFISSEIYNKLINFKIETID